MNNILEIKTQSPKHSFEALVEQTRPSVVQVRSGQHGAGTGVVWKREGLILTNNHVVAQAQRMVKVTLTDGRELSARVLARNPKLDLALLETEARDLPDAVFGDSAGLRVGQLVLAIGHPWGQPWVVTAGIISALGEVEMSKGHYASYIRSDVRLAPGNSGGPLLNANAEVVGINAMIFGGDLAVAIPTHVAAAWLELAIQPSGNDLPLL